MREKNTSLHPLIERLRALVAPLLVSPEAAIPPPLAAVLRDFHAASEKQYGFARVGETARSLASLLAHCGDCPTEEERVQVMVLVASLLGKLAPEAAVSAAAAQPLVTPVTPSAATGNNRIAFYVDSGALLVMLRETLAQAGFEPVNVDSLDVLAATDAASCPAAIIADLSLCRLDPQSQAVFAGLRRRCSPPPHLFCLAPSDDIAARLEAVRLGATRFLSQPLDAARLIAILKGVTSKTPVRPFKVVLVEDDPSLGEVYRRGLVGAGVEVEVVAEPLRAPALIAEGQPDVVVCDLFMPACNGFELLALLRQDDSLADTPIVLLSSEPEVGRRMEALDLGADDFFSKPVDMPLLVATVIARAKRARMLKRSRSEYRRILQRLRDVEARVPGQFPGQAEADVELQLLSTETINLDDYVVGEVGQRDAAD